MTMYILQSSTKQLYVAEPNVAMMADDPSNPEYRYATEDELAEHFEFLAKKGLIDPGKVPVKKKRATTKKEAVIEEPAPAPALEPDAEA